MAKIRQFFPNRMQHENFKSKSVPGSPKTIRPLVESGFLSTQEMIYPLPSWILKDKILFRGLYDFSNPKLEWSAKYFSERIRNFSPPGTIFFVDTGFFSVPIDFVMWDAILSRKIAITPAIKDELSAWLSSPHHNQQLSDLIRSQTEKGLPQIEFIDLNQYKEFSFNYYLALLSLRKDAWKKVLPDFINANGRQPTNDEMRNLLQKQSGDSAALSMKGWLDRRKANIFADEELVIAAVLTSILRGVETVILTRDQDIISQFVSVTNMIQSHYESMNAGDYFWDHIEEYSNLFPPHVVPDFRDKKFFGISKVSGIHFSSEQSHELMTSNPLPAIMHCLLFDNVKLKQKFSVASFYGETGMRNLLSMKGRSKGKNSDRFGEYNCILTNGLLEGTPRHTFLIHDDLHVQIGNSVVTELDVYYATRKKTPSSHMFYRKY